MARSKVKKNSILNFVAVTVLAIFGLILSIGGFDIPFTQQTYYGFARNISLGLDLAGGISVVYDCSLPSDAQGGDLEQAIDATVARLTDVIAGEYSEATITRQGASKIRIEVPSETDTEAVFDLIGQPTPLYMTLSTDTNDVRLTGSDIADVRPTYQQKEDTGEYEYGVSVRFNSEGATKFQKLTEDAANGSQTIYIYIGEIGEVDPLQLTCEKKILGDSTFISGSFEDWDDAKAYALRIMSGTFNCNLELLENNVISATLGVNALKYCLIGGAVGLLLIFILMWIRYGDLGFLANFALVIYIILMLFFLQAISFVQLTLPGLAGIILSIGMAVDGTVIIFERIREEYRSGKKIPLASKIGFKRAFWPIFDSNITTIITAVVLYILGTASIQGFAITLLIGILLSMFMNLVILRFFVKWYIPLNSTKPKKLHLPKQERVFKESQPSNSNLAVEGGRTND